MTQVGLGQHIWNLSELQLEEYYKVRLSRCGKGFLPLLTAVNT